MPSEVVAQNRSSDDTCISDICPNGYFMMFGWAYDRGLSFADLGVYGLLGNFGTFDAPSNSFQKCRPSRRTMARIGGCSVDVIKRSLARLVAAGLIERHERYAADGSQLPSEYTISCGMFVAPPRMSNTDQFVGGGRNATPGGMQEPKIQGVSTNMSNTDQFVGGGIFAPEGGAGEHHNKEVLNPKEKPKEKPYASGDPMPDDESRSKSAPKTKPQQRGTRLPEDFKITPDMQKWATDNVPELAGRGETDRFVDYWRAIPGAKGLKLDWPATWRNWMRTASDRASRPSGYTPKNGQAIQKNFKYDNPFDDLPIQVAVESADDGGLW